MYEYIPEVMTFKECKGLLKVGKKYFAWFDTHRTDTGF